jgi:hypothetical protein
MMAGCENQKSVSTWNIEKSKRGLIVPEAGSCGHARITWGAFQVASFGVACAILTQAMATGIFEKVV